MSDTRFAPVDADERETAREPAKRWRNKWLTHTWPQNIDTGEAIGPGPGIYDSPRSFDTRAEAVRDAERIIAANMNAKQRAPMWLGAFPDGEAP